MGFFSQEYWIGLPFPSPGDLLDTGIEPKTSVSPALQVDFLFFFLPAKPWGWRRKWQPTPVFLPGESQGLGSLVGCRLQGRTESDTTEATQQQQQQQVSGEAPSYLLLRDKLFNKWSQIWWLKTVSICYFPSFLRPRIENDLASDFGSESLIRFQSRYQLGLPSYEVLAWLDCPFPRLFTWLLAGSPSYLISGPLHEVIDLVNGRLHNMDGFYSRAMEKTLRIGAIKIVIL